MDLLLRYTGLWLSAEPVIGSQEALWAPLCGRGAAGGAGTHQTERRKLRIAQIEHRTSTGYPLLMGPGDALGMRQSGKPCAFWGSASRRSPTAVGSHSHTPPSALARPNLEHRNERMVLAGCLALHGQQIPSTCARVHELHTGISFTGLRNSDSDFGSPGISLHVGRRQRQVGRRAALAYVLANA
eukprot:352361-Chlamydomonas_euryale.AAC.9